ncbi:MAG: polysaccharide deacetylase [Actinophytocola sp.]|nr:polysaccharide deacetylase [Actinophytocola sp.]
MGVRPRKRDLIGVAIPLAVTVVMLLMLGAGHHSRLTSTAAPSTSAETTAPATTVTTTLEPPDDRPQWMHRLAPGEKPPQFVLFSFDGVGSHEHWSRLLPEAKAAGAHVTGFLSGVYLLPDADGASYAGPGHGPGDSSIGFGGTAADVRTRVADLNAALRAGHEIGTHYNGHFCRGAEPSGGAGSAAQWNAELDAFFAFVRRAPGLRLRTAAIKGGRTPCLEGQFDKVFAASRAHGLAYDSSKVSTGVVWPELRDGVWEFFLPSVRVPALGRRVIMMDYNLWYALGQAQDRPDRRDEFRAATLQTYWEAYRAAFAGNRAPLVVANHFNDWSGGAFREALDRFLGDVCRRPHTVCATYSEVVRWLRMQDRATLARLRAMPPADP